MFDQSPAIKSLHQHVSIRAVQEQNQAHVQVRLDHLGLSQCPWNAVQNQEMFVEVEPADRHHIPHLLTPQPKRLLVRNKLASPDAFQRHFAKLAVER